MENKFIIEVITPLSKLLSIDTESVILDTPTGKYGIQVLHEPSIIAIAKGNINIKCDQKWINVSVSKGFAEITNKKLLVFVDSASLDENLEKQNEKDNEIRSSENRQRRISKIEHINMQSFITKAINNIKVEKNKIK